MELSPILEPPIPPQRRIVSRGSHPSYVDPRSAKLRPNVRISLAHALARKLSQKLHRIHIEIRNFVRVQYPYQYYRGFI